MQVPSHSLLRYLRQVCRHESRSLQYANDRSFGTTASVASGHSKWATIKHDKARADAKRNKQRSMLAQQIEVVSRLYGADPEINSRLKTVIADAKRQGLPKDVLEAAMKRGQGLSTSGKSLEHLTIDAVLPGGVAVIIECTTESKGKSLMDIRSVLTKHSGSQSPVQFMFKRRGIVALKQPLPEGVDTDLIMESVLDVDGFEDLNEVDGDVQLISEPHAAKAVADAVVNALKVEVQSLEILWQPINLVNVSVDEAALADSAVEKIEAIPEVQGVYLNMRRAE